LAQKPHEAVDYGGQVLKERKGVIGSDDELGRIPSLCRGQGIHHACVASDRRCTDTTRLTSSTYVRMYFESLHVFAFYSHSRQR
jgi:hypothetical protein